jgi:hypothetical protein
MFGMDWCVAVLTPMHLQSEKYICECKAVFGNVWYGLVRGSAYTNAPAERKIYKCKAVFGTDRYMAVHPPRHLQREKYICKCKAVFGMDRYMAVHPPRHLQREKYICKCKAVFVWTSTWQCILQGTCKEKTIKQCLVWTGTWQ